MEHKDGSKGPLNYVKLYIAFHLKPAAILIPNQLELGYLACINVDHKSFRLELPSTSNGENSTIMSVV